MITITGTPGTGKTTLSILFEQEGYSVLRLNEYMEGKDIGEVIDGEREVEVSEMISSLEEEDLDEDTVIEGHLSHKIDSDVCIVLRCSPRELNKRLEKRDYSQDKIRDNVESEKIDLVLAEAESGQDQIIELDTTEDSPEQTFQKAINRIKEERYSYGEVDWSEFI